MKKILPLLIALCLFFCCLPLFAWAASDTAAAPIVPEDFTVRTIDGTDFTLSEALKDHDLVMINLWATWCPPCRMEFPYLQEAWTQRQDKVALLALSVEPSDSEDVLKSFAEEMNLTFPIANVGDTGMDAFVTIGIPTTVLIDRAGKVAQVEVGAKASAQEFLDLFDSYTGKGYNPDLCTYTIIAHSDTEYLPDVTVSFCTDEACVPVTTDKSGTAVFTGAPASYHLHLIKAPEGHRQSLEYDICTDPYSQTIYVYLPEE